MFAATHFDQFLVFIFFAIAIFFQILTSAAAKNRKRRGDTQRRSTSPSQRSRPLTTEAEKSDEDQIRKFLEALGQPTTSKPPPPARPRPTYQRPDVLAKPFGSPLPPLKTRPPDLPEEIQKPIQAAPKPERKIFKPKSEMPAFEVHEGPPPITAGEVRAAFQPSAPAGAKPSEAKIDVSAMLRSTSGLRDAIILREIFGPPRSLQPLDFVGTV